MPAIRMIVPSDLNSFLLFPFFVLPTTALQTFADSGRIKVRGTLTDAAAPTGAWAEYLGERT